MQLAAAIQAEAGTITGASWVTRPSSGHPTAVLTGPLAGMPTHGGTAALLTTGDARLADQPNDSGGSGAALGGMPVRGNSDYDVTILRIDINAPSTSNCLAGIDFRFLSEEYPEYVGSSFNDAFIAELGSSTWTTSGSSISAPNNFAFDPSGSPITINAAGVTSMTAEHAAGTTYDGGTALLTAATPIPPGPNSLFLSIFDQGDMILDSAVIVDNLRFSKVADVKTDCKPGAQLAKPAPRNYVALGDSFSSGFGVKPYMAGTNFDKKKGNDCQRSELAYSARVASVQKLPLEFYACQGGVTTDFYNPRSARHPSDWADWGEVRQLDHLDDKTALSTLTAGGNDAQFSDVLAECILGMELLPWNTCYNDEKVTKPVREAFERLDSTRSTPADVYPYKTLFRDMRQRAKYGKFVAIGYPMFFPEGGGDRTFLPGGRCEGVKKADQRWMREQIGKLNGIIDKHAQRTGFLFADPNSRFVGHELCGEKAEWFFPLTNPGRVHPTAEGQAAMGDTVNEVLSRNDVSFADGEPLEVATIQEDAPNVAPRAAFTWALDGQVLSLDGSASSDTDGQVVDWDWYVSSPQADLEATGRTASVALDGRGPWSITLAATDNRGDVAFATQSIARISVRQEAIQPDNRGVIPVWVLSTPAFDATKLDVAALRFGPDGARAARSNGNADLDGDGRADLLLHFPTEQTGAARSGGQMCLAGVHVDGVAFQGCDTVKLVPGR
jgi:lysophospholipase L1-like esterase